MINSKHPIMTALSAFKAPNVFNPWNDCDVIDARPHEWTFRQARLAQHFDCKPEFLLIGEAPGYQGCHFSGVPFTNEKLLLSGAIPRVPCNARITTRMQPWSEPSATIVWGTLHTLNIAERTVMWNAFAWHPHTTDDPMSNRPPSQYELKAGAHVLKAVLQHFGCARIVAVGKVAARSLRLAGVHDFEMVRHPSMGGATEFRKQMAELVTRAA